MTLVLSWRKATQHHLPSILESAWALLTGCLPMYISGIVRGDEEIDDGEVALAKLCCHNAGVTEASATCDESLYQSLWLFEDMP